MGSTARSAAAAVVALLLLCLSACGGSPTGPTPPPPPAALGIACPANQAAVAIQDDTAAVSYPAAATTGGRAPVQVSCTPAAGTAFAVGLTTVACTASDAAGQTASCSFTVTVTRAPRITVTRFVAFGDSITWGTDAPPAPFSAYPLPAPPTSYPTQLSVLLSQGYPAQTITVANEGWPGEAIDHGLERLPQALAANEPEVLLLLHGANDLLGNPSRSTAERIADRLHDMVRTTRARVPGIRILLANFPPQYHGTVPYDRGAGAEFVPELNARIADVANREGVVLVDLYGAMIGDLKQNIGQDGLHPTVRGFTVMAETFAAAIQRQFSTVPNHAPGDLVRPQD